MSQGEVGWCVCVSVCVCEGLVHFWRCPRQHASQCARGSETVWRSRGGSAPDVPRTLEGGGGGGCWKVKGRAISVHHKDSEPECPLLKKHLLRAPPHRPYLSSIDPNRFQGWQLEFGIGSREGRLEDRRVSSWGRQGDKAYSRAGNVSPWLV